MNTTQSHIALHVPTLAGGGAERVMVNLANEYARRGINVDLVLYRAEGHHISEVDTGVNIVDLKAKKTPFYAALGAFRTLRSYISEEQPQGLLSGLTRANVVAILANRAARSNTYLVVTEHNHLKSTIGGDEKQRLKMLPILARCTYPLADDIVAVSDGVADSLSRESGLRRDSIQTVYNPVVTDDLKRKASEPCPHSWLDSGENIPVVLGAGSFTPQKDFSTLIRAFYRLREIRAARLIILSDGELREELTNLVKDLGLEDVVDMPGFVENPYSYMRAADVFALSSKWEGLPTVLIEAMACGAPVVSTDCPSGPSEILVEGKYGTLVPVGEPHELAEAILDALEDPIPADELRRRADDFSVESVADEYLDILFSKESTYPIEFP